MPSRHLVDGELAALLEVWPDTPFSLETLPAIRANMQYPFPPELNPTVDVWREKAPGAPGAPPLEVFIVRSKTARNDRGGILHIHGGGFVLGSTAMIEPIARAARRDRFASLARVLG